MHATTNVYIKRAKFRGLIHIHREVKSTDTSLFVPLTL